VVLAGLAWVSACSSDQYAQGCTRIGCDSGIYVDLSRVPAEAYRLELSPLGATAKYVVECADPEACGTRHFFRDFTPDVVTVRLIIGADTVFWPETILDYVETQPNGPNCPPTCFAATIALPVP